MASHVERNGEQEFSLVDSAIDIAIGGTALSAGILVVDGVSNKDLGEVGLGVSILAADVLGTAIQAIRAY